MKKILGNYILILIQNSISYLPMLKLFTFTNFNRLGIKLQHFDKVAHSYTSNEHYLLDMGLRNMTLF